MFNQTRLKFTFIAFFILLAFIMFDIFQLQTTEFQSTSEIVDQQNLDKFYITAPRGEIFDTNGEKIAETKLEPHLFINMRKITNENSSDYRQIIQYNFPDLTNREINEIFEFDIVTRDTLHNYFTRPHLMKLKLKRLQSLGIERSIVSFPAIPE